MQNDLLTGYNVHPAADREAMLREAGLSSVEDLFAAIDPSIRLNRRLNLPGPLTEWALERQLRERASRNATTLDFSSFLGAGAYEHYIPEIVRTIASRGEFLTAYTPYQPEMSQGWLRVLYDFQLLMGRLLGLPAVNCSVYDGATALAEAGWMACRIQQKRRLIVASNLWPDVREVLETYLNGRRVEVVDVPSDPNSGVLDLNLLKSLLNEAPAAALLVQSPNRYGVVETFDSIVELCKANGTLVVASCYPMALGCLRSPGSLGADIVCCEAQSLGLELNAGGPYLGVIAAREEYVPHLPGRIVGVCADLKGEEAFALIKESREQHVARHEATSHICSNQALLALRASVYLSALGEQGFRKASALCAAKARYLQQRLTSIDGVRLAKSGAFFNEFLLDLPCSAADLLERLRERRIFGGVDFSSFEPDGANRLLIAVTETKTKEDLDRCVECFTTALQSAPLQ